MFVLVCFACVCACGCVFVVVVVLVVFRCLWLLLSLLLFAFFVVVAVRVCLLLCVLDVYTQAVQKQTIDFPRHANIDSSFFPPVQQSHGVGLGLGVVVVGVVDVVICAGFSLLWLLVLLLWS